MSLALNASIAHEDPALLDPFYRYATAHPADHFVITSGDRSKQPAHGYAPGVPVAAEGTSNHELFAYGKAAYDEAIDVVENGQPIGSTAGSELTLWGIHVPLSSDLVHVTPAWVSG